MHFLKLTLLLCFIVFLTAFNGREKKDYSSIGNFSLDEQGQFPQSTKKTLKEYDLTVAGLVKITDIGVDGGNFRVFVADANNIYYENEGKINNSAPSINKLERIRLFFERGRDIYVFHIVEPKDKKFADGSKLFARHFYFEKNKLEMKSENSSIDLLSPLKGTLKEKSLKIFGSSRYGFYTSDNCECIKIGNSPCYKADCKKDCRECEFCVYDYMTGLRKISKKQLLILKRSGYISSVFNNFVEEIDKSLSIVMPEDIKQRYCFEMDNGTLHQIQLWNNHWRTETNLSQALIENYKGQSIPINPTTILPTDESKREILPHINVRDLGIDFIGNVHSFSSYFSTTPSLISESLGASCPIEKPLECSDRLDGFHIIMALLCLLELMIIIGGAVFIYLSKKKQIDKGAEEKTARELGS